METERRAAIELRAASGRRLEGYAAVFNVPTQIADFREMVVPGAFRTSLADGSDILALVDHDMTRLIGRTSSQTLRLAEDAKGLHFDISVPPTQLGSDILALAERRDLGGASIGFRVQAEKWPTRSTRELHAVQLVEISIVAAHAAYPTTSVAARARVALDRGAQRRRAWLRTI